MRGSHLGMRTPRVGGRCQRGVRTPSCERRPGDDARFASGDANSADGGALSTRSSHALVRTAARRRCAVRIWGCELRGWGGVVNVEFARPRANGGQGRCAVCIWGCELRGWGGVVNAEFARPRANGGQETMRGSHLGMRTPRVGGRCQRGVRTPSCERRPGDDARFASGDANSAGGGALSTRSSHALVRTAARRRCAVRIWGCELRGWGGVVNAEFARPRANGGQETMRGSHLGMRTPRMGGRCQRGVRTPTGERRPGDDARFASGDANSADGGALSTRSSHALVRTAARGDARFASGDANSAGGGALSTWSSHAHVRTAVRGDARFASGDANSADGGALSTRSSHALVRTAARRRCAVRIWGCELRGWGGADVGRCQHADRYSTCADRLRWHAKRPSRNDWAVWRCSGPITFHASRFTPHVSRLTFHASRFTPHVSRLTFHASRFTPHVSRLTPHVSRFTPHASRFTPHVSRFTFHATPHAAHVSRLTFHASRFTPHVSRLTPHVSRFTFHASRFTLHRYKYPSSLACCVSSSWNLGWAMRISAWARCRRVLPCR
jgi:hypothetical protein